MLWISIACSYCAGNDFGGGEWNEIPHWVDEHPFITASLDAKL